MGQGLGVAKILVVDRELEAKAKLKGLGEFKEPESSVKWFKVKK